MFCTPEQRQIGRWIENRYDIDKVQCAEAVTKNTVRLTLRGHEPTILILRQNGGGPEPRGGAFRGGRLTSCQYCTPREE
ncbi:MAG: hypothetical protein ACLURW_04840 [Flavonifractor plautii]